MSEREQIKEEIIRIFRKRLKGRKTFNETANQSASRTVHMGSEGHELERAFGIRANSSRKADYKGFELKKEVQKMTLGDWTASEYIYSKVAPILQRVNGEKHLYMEKNEFIRTFGYPNDSKDGRFSWSGRATPRYNKWNDCGQTLTVCPMSGNIYVVYSHQRDKRVTSVAVPDAFKSGYIVLVVWYGDRLRENVDMKWNQRGYFQVHRGSDGRYSHVSFGRPFGYEDVIRGIRRGWVIFESGMVENNNRSRNCSKFRVFKKQNDAMSPFLLPFYDGTCE